MRYAIVLLLAAAGLTLGGTYLSRHEGYVELGLADGTYQMPLWYFLVALVATVLVLALLSVVLWSIIRLPSKAKNLGKKRRQLVANNLLQKGMREMGQGHWKKAENLLVKGSRVAHKAQRDPSLFLATAAQAAQEQGADKRRDQYLLEARQLSAEGVDTFTSALSEARLHLLNKAPQKALDALAEHRHLHLSNPELLAVEAQANEQLGHYTQVWDILGKQKRHCKDKATFAKRQTEVAKSLFNDERASLASIEKVWSELPRKDKLDDGIFLNYISGLISHGQEEKAEQLLSKAIRRHYSDPLVHAYTQLETGSSNARLKKLRQWLRAHPDSAYLNYGAAKFAYQSEQIDLARDYAEASVKLQPLPEAYDLLGKIYEVQGESQQALAAYKGAVGLIYAEESTALSGHVLASPKTVSALPDASVTTDSQGVLDDSAKVDGATQNAQSTT